ncbi:MAG: glycoside hydrolase family 92 protein, partial [Sphingobacteriales bacterium]
KAKLILVMITGDEILKQNFYTALYHTFINPTLYMDADSLYKGLDQNVHRTEGFVNYTTFSLWDTYRALHPLFTLLQPQRNNDMIRSMLAHYDQSPEHMLPVWSNSANENWCMSGYHSVAVLADAVVKGIYIGDADKVLEACVTTARNRGYENIGNYIDQGYIADETSGTSVSTTLEYAYDDWAIAQMALKLDRRDIYDEFIKRSANYKNVYDAASGFMRPRRRDGSFRSPFDPLSTHGGGFIEGNAWNFSLFVPQDPKGLIALMGGNKRFVRYLDSLFTMHLPDKYFAETEDITRDGIIGNYVHGNEPSHHVAYLYNWTDQPWKTQERVRMILPLMYRPTPDGLGGNDDCGQMSAWYIFSALGFYPVAPGSDQYALGSPAVERAVLHLDGDKLFTISTLNQGPKNVYVSKVLLNGKELKEPFIRHSDMMNGGELVFYMSAKHR